MTVRTTTPVGTEGFNISYRTEMEVGSRLNREIGKEWTVEFQWLQFMAFCDLSYSIDFENKIVWISYNQNLMHWSNPLIKEISDKIKKHNEKL